MNIIVGDALSDKHGFDLNTLETWGNSLITQLDGIQDSNKMFREEQVGWDKKPGQTGISELEARVPPRLMYAYLQAHPDFDVQDDRHFYKFLREHPEIDTRRRREAHVKA